MLTKLTRTFIFGNLFVALCAYLLSLEELYFEGKLSIVNPISLFIFFSTLLIYNYRKSLFSDIELIPAHTQRAQWLRANRFLLGIITLSALFGIVISAFNLNAKTLIFLVPLFLISVFYATPFSTEKKSTKRLRHLPFLKLFLVAGVWTVVSVVLPQLEIDASQLFSAQLIFSCFTRFVFIFSITLPFDIRDVEVDKKNNIKTFPVVLGVKRAIQLDVTLLVVFIALYVFNYFSGDRANELKSIAYILSGIVSILFVLQVPKQKSEYYISFWIEGLMLMQFILLFIFRSFIA